MKTKPNLNFWKLWNISFGFFGVQIAYALQSANISRIFTTLGSDPHDLSYFWILPPLMGILVQPIVGVASDKTWTRFGRRIPYLFVGSLVAIIVMLLLPNAGSFNMSVSTAMIFGLIALMFLDTSINMAMQPFKMLVGDMVNEKQKGLAYSIQSFLCNAGSVVGFLFPILFTWIGISNIAPDGVIPDTVIYSFYIGALILIGCVIYTTLKVKEMPPKEYNEYHNIDTSKKEDKIALFSLLKKAPKVFWTVGVVQFFCWGAFMYMWTYTPGSIAKGAFDAPVIEKIQSLEYTDNGKVITLTGNHFSADAQNLTDEKGTYLAASDAILKNATVLQVDQQRIELTDAQQQTLQLHKQKRLDSTSKEYQEAGNWVGVLFAVQAIGSVIWAIFIPFFKNKKFIYALSLLLGGIGFISVGYVHDPHLLFASYALIGCAWAAILALPFTLLTNALSGAHMGAYLGLFNGTICIPQIVASLLGGSILGFLTPTNGIAPEIDMLSLAGIFLFVGAGCVYLIKEEYGEKQTLKS
ncbi:MAG: MFS transporter [Bacteroidaceae bacterium]